jgi:hypothetical protein
MWLRSFLVALTTIAVACSKLAQSAEPAPVASVSPSALQDTTPTMETGRRITWGGLDYEAVVNALHTTPMRIATVVSISVASGARARAPLAPCPLGLRVYPSPNRAGRPVWDANRRLGGACAPYPRSDSLAGVHQRGHLLYRYDPVLEILGDSLPPGRYYFEAVLRLEGTTIEFQQGEGELSPDTLLPVRSLEGLRFQPEVRLEPAGGPQAIGTMQILEATVQITNASERRVEITYGPCSFSIRAYREPSRSGTPAWDSLLQRRASCPDIGYEAVLVPGESFPPGHLRVEAAVPEILGDSLPSSRYYFTAILELNRDTLRITAGNADLDSQAAGS